MSINKYELQAPRTQRGTIINRSRAPVPLTDQTYALAERACAQADLSALRTKLNGALALQAMNSMAMLASAEEHFNQIAPGGCDEYRMISKAFSYAVVQELTRGEW